MISINCGQEPTFWSSTNGVKQTGTDDDNSVLQRSDVVSIVVEMLSEQSASHLTPILGSSSSRTRQDSHEENQRKGSGEVIRPEVELGGQ